MSSDDNLHQFCYKISMNEQAVAPFIEAENIYIEEVGFKGKQESAMAKRSMVSACSIRCQFAIPDLLGVLVMLSTAPKESKAFSDKILELCYNISVNYSN